MNADEIKARCETPSRGRKCEKIECPENQQQTCWIGYLAEEQIVSACRKSVVKNPEQIKKDLHSAAAWFQKHGRNSNTAVIDICAAAADLIEYLQEQLNEESGAAKLYARQRNELREQLSASQAREREALEALEESRAYWKRAETEAIKYQNLYLNYRNEFGYLPDDFVGREEPGEVKRDAL